MSPLLRGAILVTLVSALVRAAELSSGNRPGSARAAPVVAGVSHGASTTSLCPPRTLPDGQVCIPVPEVAAQATADLGGSRWQLYAHIPRRPERPEDYLAYRLPIT